MHYGMAGWGTVQYCTLLRQNETRKILSPSLCPKVSTEALSAVKMLAMFHIPSSYLELNESTGQSLWSCFEIHLR